jgi:hypothetical protein
VILCVLVDTRGARYPPVMTVKERLHQVVEEMSEESVRLQLDFDARTVIVVRILPRGRAHDR